MQLWQVIWARTASSCIWVDRNLRDTKSLAVSLLPMKWKFVRSSSACGLIVRQRTGIQNTEGVALVLGPLNPLARSLGRRTKKQKV